MANISSLYFDKCECPCHEQRKDFPHSKFCCEKPNELKDPVTFYRKACEPDPERIWQGYVYFVLVVSGDPFVKVGYSEEQWPAQRVAQLQTGCPYELKLMGIIRPKGQIAKSLEAEIHEDLASDRIRGEWFEVTEKMDKWLEQLELMDDLAVEQYALEDV